jgi:hypothetical protein
MISECSGFFNLKSFKGSEEGWIVLQGKDQFRKLNSGGRQIFKFLKFNLCTRVFKRLKNSDKDCSLYSSRTKGTFTDKSRSFRDGKCFPKSSRISTPMTQFNRKEDNFGFRSKNSIVLYCIAKFFKGIDSLPF